MSGGAPPCEHPGWSGGPLASACPANAPQGRAVTGCHPHQSDPVGPCESPWWVGGQAGVGDPKLVSPPPARTSPWGEVLSPLQQLPWSQSPAGGTLGSTVQGARPLQGGRAGGPILRAASLSVLPLTPALVKAPATSWALQPVTGAAVPAQLSNPVRPRAEPHLTPSRPCCPSLRGPGCRPGGQGLVQRSPSADSDVLLILQAELADSSS